MGDRTQYAPGTFSWTDLATTDQDAAKTFYAGLFGWQADDRPVDESTVYSMQLVGGKPVAAVVNAAGALCWNELATPDFDAAQAFYGGLFGWTFDAFEGGGMPYFTIKVGGANNGGMRPPQPGEPPNWLVYFGTDDTDASL